MISRKPQLPVLQSRFCVFADYNAAWIAGLLQDAADRTGIPLPFKKEITQSVMLFLEEYYPLSSMPLDYLFERMRAMLREVGLRALADNLQRQTPPVEISLADMTAAAPLPLFFYTGLKRTIDDLREKGLTNCIFSGKRECALTLSRKKRWSKESQRTMCELDRFIAACSGAPEHEAELQADCLPGA